MQPIDTSLSIRASDARAAESVSADTSEFWRAELGAFVEQAKRRRPGAWALVQRLQAACLYEKPATAEGYASAEKLFAWALTRPPAPEAVARIPL